MTNRGLYVWLIVLLIGSSLCQNQKNIIITTTSIFCVGLCIFLFWKNRLNTYRSKKISHYKLLLLYELFAIISISSLVMTISIFVLDKSHGVYFLFYLSLIVPIFPVILNTARANRK